MAQRSTQSRVGRAIRTQRWKYTVTAPGKNGSADPGSNVYEEEFLYDLEADPYELCNLIELDTYSHVAAELRERLIQRMNHAGETAPIIKEATVRPGGQRRTRVNELRVKIGNGDKGSADEQTRICDCN